MAGRMKNTGNMGRPRAVSPEAERARVEARLARVAEMYCGRMTMAAIGAELGVSQVQITRDVQELHRRWKEARGTFDEAREKELAKLDRMEQEAYAMWELTRGEEAREETQEHAERKKGKRPAKGEEDVREVEIKLVGRTVKFKYNSKAGSVYWWEQQKWCVEQRCKLLGLYVEPKEKAATMFVQVNVGGESKQVPVADYWAGLISRGNPGNVIEGGAANVVHDLPGGNTPEPDGPGG